MPCSRNAIEHGIERGDVLFVRQVDAGSFEVQLDADHPGQGEAPVYLADCAREKRVDAAEPDQPVGVLRDFAGDEVVFRRHIGAVGQAGSLAEIRRRKNDRAPDSGFVEAGDEIVGAG